MRSLINKLYKFLSGRAEDVAIAAAEIREAAEHFTVIRAQRTRVGSMVAAHGVLGSEHGTVTVKVRVPYKVVGLVVGLVVKLYLTSRYVRSAGIHAALSSPQLRRRSVA